MADWASMQSDVLSLISDRLRHPFHYIRFRSVCTRWHAAAPRRPQLPLLIAHCWDYADEKPNTVFAFLTVSPSGILPFSPALKLRMTCYGSSHGLMTLFDIIHQSITLFNPATGSKIPLPPLRGYPDVNHFGIYGCHCFLGDYPNAAWMLTNETMEVWTPDEYRANKIVLPADPFTAPGRVAMVISCFRTRLQFCRPGDEVWTPVACPFFWYRDNIRDVLFYRGKFYVTSTCKLYVCDIAQVAKLIEIPFKDTDIENFFSFMDLEGFTCHGCYLVESSGDLLLVRTFELVITEEEAQGMDLLEEKGKCLIEVHKLVLGVNGNRLRLVGLRSLGDRALFLGRNQSISLTASKYPGCKGSHVYVVTGEGVRVFNLKDGNSELLYLPSRWNSLGWEAFTWIMPNLQPEHVRDEPFANRSKTWNQGDMEAMLERSRRMNQASSRAKVDGELKMELIEEKPEIKLPDQDKDDKAQVTEDEEFEDPMKTKKMKS